MWTLLLSRVGDPPGTFFDRRQLDSGEIRIGRNEKTCDIVLPDTEGFISREHCRLAGSGLDLFVIDMSKNGVALNQPGARIVPNQPVPVRPGDRLIIHDFVVTIATAAEGAGIGLTPAPPPPLRAEAPARLESDPWLVPPSDAFGQADMGIGPAETHDFLRGALPGAAPPAPVEPIGGGHPSDFGFADPFGAAFSRPIMADPLPMPADFGIPEDWASTPLDQSAPFPPPDDLPPPPFADSDGFPPTEPIPDIAPAAPAPPSAPQPAPQAAPDPAWEAFFEGAGLTPADLQLAPDAMRRLGALYRQVVLGLCDVLQDRAAFKDEFRVERTQLSIGRNNPFKHLAPLEAAKILLDQPLPGFMATEDAVRTSFEDIKWHQLAMLAGVQQALAVAFDRLSPQEIERFSLAQREKRGGLPWQKPDKWGVYVTVFEALQRDATSNANGVMSVAFREGYEKFMRSAR